jgi:hypothetical protein
MIFRLVLLCCTFLFLNNAAVAADPPTHSPGQWVQHGDFAQANVACIQVWRCTQGVDVLHPGGTRIVTTPDKSTIGTCSAGGGAADSCNACITGPPTDPCEYWQEDE